MGGDEWTPKTREELARSGILLEGPIVPGWFKEKCDGCSVPKGALRWVLKAEQARAACVIHDFMYYTVALMYEESVPEWHAERAIADFVLRRNRALVARWRSLGKVYSLLYWFGVRYGGASALRKRGRDLKGPPLLDDLNALCENHLARSLTNRAQTITDAWEKHLNEPGKP